MKINKNGEIYIDFDTYLRQGEPSQKEKAFAWSTAIGLQAVDGLTTSKYLQETAKRNIDGEITIDEAQQLIKSYYTSRKAHDNGDDEKEEADRVSGNITKILSSKTMEFSVYGFTSLHRRIFEGVFRHAGEIRDYDISKKEWVLHGDSVAYWPCEELRAALNYDIQQEKEFHYAGLSMDEIVKHLTTFVSNLWEIHPFREGNTRTTAVFTIKYLRANGFNVNNDLFAKYSYYFRNALVRANYAEHEKGIDREPIYLERFFRNLLMGEQWVLQSRYLYLDPPEEYKEQPRLDTPEQVPVQVPDQVMSKHQTSTEHASNQFYTDSENIKRLVLAIGEQHLSVKQMMETIGLKHRMNFMEYSLNPAMREGFVCMLYPNSPRHPRQKYLLTVKGVGLYHQLNPKEE